MEDKEVQIDEEVSFYPSFLLSWCPFSRVINFLFDATFPAL